MAHETRTQAGPADPSRGAIERSDLDPRAARRALIGMVGIVAVVGIAVALLMRLFGGLHEPAAPHPAATPMSLQTNEPADRAAIEARATARIDGHDGGVPIDRAMQQTAGAGWDAP